MLRKKSVLISITIIIICLGIGGWYVYTKILNPPHREVKQEVAMKVDAEKIFQAYTANEKTANATYLDKAIEVSGKITSIAKNADSSIVVFLQTSDPIFGVKCTMEGNASALKEGDVVIIKGICTGFINDVVVIRSYVVNNSENKKQ
jgi:hypothetical protein